MAAISTGTGTSATASTTTTGYYTGYGDYYYSGYSRNFESFKDNNIIVGSDPAIKKELSFEDKLQDEIDDWLGIFNE